MTDIPANPRRRSLTQLAQQRIAAVVRDGDYAVDATVGNGHDTLFLARQVGSSGHVWGFDLQAAALDATRHRLMEHGLSERVTLIRDGHQHLAKHLPAAARGQLAAAMFNLGYLPGSDKRITTAPESTLTALGAARDQLRRGGLLSVLAYRGHCGGQEEADAVQRWLAECGLLVETVESPGPVLHLASKA
jgi:predicted methyltransferase